MMKKTNAFISEPEIEFLLKADPRFKKFWEHQEPIVIIRKRPKKENPVYEIQMALALGERMESYGWVWIDAMGGDILDCALD